MVVLSAIAAAAFVLASVAFAEARRLGLAALFALAGLANGMLFAYLVLSKN